MAKEGKIDIVFDHTRFGIDEAKQLEGSIPVLSTQHGPLTPPFIENEEIERLKNTKGVYYIAISEDQKSQAELRWIGVVSNGIDLDEFDPPQKTTEEGHETFGNKYLVYLGRIAKQHEIDLKGVRNAIAVANELGVRLVIAGKPEPDTTNYFEREIKPQIDGKLICYINEVNSDDRRNLLKYAGAFMALNEWREPFGLTFAEAQAAGLPVVATPLGSLTDIVAEDKTGLFVKKFVGDIRNSPEAFADACQKTWEILLGQHYTPQACRERTALHYSRNVMVAGHAMVAFAAIIKNKGNPESPIETLRFEHRFEGNRVRVTPHSIEKVVYHS